MKSFFQNMTNSKLLLIAIVAAFLALPFGSSFMGFLPSENMFLTFRLISFVLIMYVIISVINNKTKVKKKM
jgi:hypothetical protein